MDECICCCWQSLWQNYIPGKKVHLAVDIDNDDDGQKGRRKGSIRRRWKPMPSSDGNDVDDAEAEEIVSELHILGEGVALPPNGGMPPIGEPTSAAGIGTATHYVHERAIFDELTHLKRMQIQYGKVREEVLVRSLVQNFCRMHGIHPSHFRRISTFNQWEKFLYDQLKMIYLEERERLANAAAAAAQKAASVVGMRPGAIYSARQRVFASTSTSASVMAGRHFTSGIEAAEQHQGLAKKFDSRILPRINPLDQRLHELRRIYSGSTSRGSATISALAVTNSIAAKASAAAESQQRRKQQQKTAAQNGRDQQQQQNGKNRMEILTKAPPEPKQLHKRCECLE